MTERIAARGDDDQPAGACFSSAPAMTAELNLPDQREVFMANVRYIDVTEPEQMQLEITRLVAAGFTVANQSDRSVTLVKRKQFSIPMLIIGLLLCVVPLLIYLIVYASQSDQIVEIRLIDKPKMTPYRASDHIAADSD